MTAKKKDQYFGRSNSESNNLPPPFFFDPDSVTLAALEVDFESVIYGKVNKNQFIERINSKINRSGRIDLRLLGHLVYSAILCGHLKEISAIVESVLRFNGEEEVYKDDLRQAAAKGESEQMLKLVSNIKSASEWCVVVIEGDLSAPKRKSLQFKKLSPKDFATLS